MRRIARRILDALSSLILYEPARRAAAASFLAGCVPAFLVFGGLFNLGMVPPLVYLSIVACGVAVAWMGGRDSGAMDELYVLGYAGPYIGLACSVASSEPTWQTFWRGCATLLIVAVLSATLGRLVTMTDSEYRVAKRRRAGRCPTCGYDLRASPERCPECGAAPPAQV